MGFLLRVLLNGLAIFAAAWLVPGVYLAGPVPAVIAGLILGLVIEWSTLVIDSRWKLAIGFVILILVLMIRPQGIFGKARSV